jgi:hypothetical protein
MNGRVWFAAALAASLVTTAILLLLLDDEGSGVALVLAVPVLLCAAPLVAGSRLRRAVAWTATAALAAGILVSLASIGLFFVPALVLLAVGTASTR